MSKDLKLVLDFKIQGDGFCRPDLLRNFVIGSIPKVVFRGDLEPNLSFEHYRKTGVATKNPPGFDDYIINVSISVVHE